VNTKGESFSVPFGKVSYHINGSYVFNDLLRLNDYMVDLKASDTEEIWEQSCIDNSLIPLNISYISNHVYGVVDPMRIFLSLRLLSTYGSVFFNTTYANKNNVDSISYYPLPSDVVHMNLRNRAALREFKQRYMSRIRQQPKRDSFTYPFNIDLSNTEVPERVMQVLEIYAEGLKQFITKNHPWFVQGWGRRTIDETIVAKGVELLEFLQLAPSVKNAKKVLESIGTSSWPPHANVEKYIMSIRDEFPAEVMEEAQYLLDNAALIPDPDERLRRDLRYMGCYAIDNEGASEIDDALSIEYLDDGQVKVWIHIADVSRWIRPGSQLSIEAERRMVSVYMPDEKISMFPEKLSTELLSLGASGDSYALSCGIIMNDVGEVSSFEVCPSKISLTRRLTYIQLDEILNPGKVSSFPINGTTEGQSPSEFINSKQQFTLSIASDLSRMNALAEIRHNYRIKKGALDEYLRHKTDLYLSVKRDMKNHKKMLVSGHPTWSNATSMSLVSEYMILMCETIGKFCTNINAPVWYKIQVPQPILQQNDLKLQEGENNLLRSLRIMKHLRAANDSKIPGPHCTSGAETYVQCTSPIRRYHDLYNHYRLKAAMHGASMGEEWAGRAKEEAGITLLDKMASADERIQTLNAVRRVVRHREQYWMQIYIERIKNLKPKPVFDCLVIERADLTTSPDGTSSSSIETIVTDSAGYYYYNVHALQLGCVNLYKMYSEEPLQRGDIVKCLLYKRLTNPVTYILIPESIDIDSIKISSEIASSKANGKNLDDDPDDDE